MTDKLIKDTIEKIKRQKIAPEGKWRFVLKKYLRWFAFALTIVLGAMSLSVVFFLMTGLDWDLHRFMHISPFQYFFLLIPKIWIFPVVVLFFLAFFEIRKTERGYKYSWQEIMFFSLGAFIIVSILFSFIGMGKRLNSTMADRIPNYERGMMTKESQWMQIEKGLIAGTITNVSQERIALIDLRGEHRNIITDRNTLVRPMVKIQKGEVVKVIGKLEGNDLRALEIRPWMGMGRGRMMQR